MVLGATTPSYDMEMEVTETFDVAAITPEAIMDNIIHFMGDIQQLAPPHSAVKINGVRAYELARAGQEVELKLRSITIEKFDIEAVNMPNIDFRVVCTKGTYIRSLVHDFGKKLNNGAYLSALCRTRSGEFKLENAWELPELLLEIQKQKTRE